MPRVLIIRAEHLEDLLVAGSAPNRRLRARRPFPVNGH